MKRFYINIDYDSRSDLFCFYTGLSPRRLLTILGLFLQGQIGRELESLGEDRDGGLIELDICFYCRTIETGEIEVDMSTFEVVSGFATNKERDQMVMELMRRLRRL